ncbi:hypothetical protein BABINDRAFT_21626, partial [Babjeviella inositovora NRRL Y-12698]
RTLFIKTADTPNENALKFLPSTAILPENRTIEFLLAREAHHSPLAVRLFTIDGVKSIMFGSDFITVEKNPEDAWMDVKPEVFSLMTEFLSNGQPIMNEGHDSESLSPDIDINDSDSDLVAMIKELIFTRIKPALQDDGGDIEYVDFINSEEHEEGIILLKLKGACRSCESSSETLKNGIETMLKHYIEEVKDVLQVSDDFQK